MELEAGGISKGLRQSWTLRPCHSHSSPCTPSKAKECTCTGSEPELRKVSTLLCESPLPAPRRREEAEEAEEGPGVCEVEEASIMCLITRQLSAMWMASVSFFGQDARYFGLAVF